MPLNNKHTRIEKALMTRLLTATPHDKAVISALIKLYRDGDMPTQRWLSLSNTEQVNRIINAIPDDNPAVIRTLLRSDNLWNQPNKPV